MFTLLDYNEMIEEANETISHWKLLMNLCKQTSTPNDGSVEKCEDHLKWSKKIKMVLMLERKEYYGTPIQEED